MLFYLAVSVSRIDVTLYLWAGVFNKKQKYNLPNVLSQIIIFSISHPSLFRFFTRALPTIPNPITPICKSFKENLPKRTLFKSPSFPSRLQHLRPSEVSGIATYYIIKHANERYQTFFNNQQCEKYT